MFKVVIRKADGTHVLTLETGERSLARAAKQLCQENDYDCVVTQEVADRVIKFKGVD